jgi:hypothetical protein
MSGIWRGEIALDYPGGPDIITRVLTRGVSQRRCEDSIAAEAGMMAMS